LICLDEFQFAKTLDNNNNELGKDKLRVIWDLLDSGKIEFIPGNSTYYLFRADYCIKRLDRLIKNGVTLENGEISEGLEIFNKVFDGFYFEAFNRNGVTLDQAYFLSEDFVEGLLYLFDSDDYSKTQIKERIKSSTLSEIKMFVLEGMRSRPATKELDLSHSLIFILGNLDEAYSMSHSMNPDISADEFHEQSSKITIAHIKRALRKRFRPEQIARMGNNHVIYKSFNNAQFRLLIKNELRRVAAFVKERFDWTISFDDSVLDIVYAEGVFPAQGTRPVLTTVKNLIESRISKVVVSVLEYQLPVSEILWVYANGNFIYTIKDKHGDVVLTISDEAKLKLENLRKSIDPETQAHVALHEAGHAILAALTLRIIPSVVVSRTASEAEGFCLINFPKGPVTRETLKKDIVLTLGGYVAEKMIFGKEFTSSGVYSDIEEASALANKAIRKYAMGCDPIHLAVESTQNEDAFANSHRHASEAISLIRECEVEAFEILKRNKLLLLKMAEYLTSNSRMEESTIELFIRQYSIETWIEEQGFIKKEDYYQFNLIIKEQIKTLESDSIKLMIESLITTEQ
jgi:cell division protease FtsH